MVSGAWGGVVADLMNILYASPFWLPIVIGVFAERIFKTKLYGRLVDIVIALVGGIALASVPLMIWSVYYDKLANEFYADLVKRGIETSGKHPSTWFTDQVAYLFSAIAGIIGALLLLYLARRILGRGKTSETAPLAKAAAAPNASIPAAPASGAASNVSVMDQIRKLGELHAEGILNDSEFATKKAELLARL